jgi:hypothetical protein
VCDVIFHLKVNEKYINQNTVFISRYEFEFSIVTDKNNKCYLDSALQGLVTFVAIRPKINYYCCRPITNTWCVLEIWIFLRFEPTSFKLLLTENCTGDCCDLLEQLQHRDNIKSRQVKKIRIFWLANSVFWGFPESCNRWLVSSPIFLGRDDPQTKFTLHFPYLNLG